MKIFSVDHNPDSVQNASQIRSETETIGNRQRSTGRGTRAAAMIVLAACLLPASLITTALFAAKEPAAKAGNARGKASAAGRKVELVRVPEGGLQPQALMDAEGTLHLIYFKGQPAAGNIFYVRLKAGESPSAPLQVNSEPGSAIAIGTIRGAQLALGKGGRVHVAWNGSNQATPKGPKGQNPMLYTRLNDEGTAFEPQRNVIQQAYGLDGGGSVAADPQGNVYVAWHADAGAGNEGGRRVWVTHSSDDGQTFVSESAAYSEPTGACGCCGMRALADSDGNVYLVYRSAREQVNRDMYLLRSTNQGKSFEGVMLGKWNIAQCPMSSESLAETPAAVYAGWETSGQVFLGRIDRKTGKVGKPIPAPGNGTGRKHPAVATSADGKTLLVWTEGTGWQKGGALAWQMFDATGKPLTEKGRIDGIPVWSFAATYASPTGQFVIVY